MANNDRGATANQGQTRRKLFPGRRVVTPVPDKDQFADSYSDPQLLAPDFMRLASALPFDSQPADLMNEDASTVDPLAGIKTPGQPVIGVQNIETDLAYIYGEMPNIDIRRFPQTLGTLFLATASLAADMPVPAAAVSVQFFSGFDFYVSFNGRAAVPTVVLFPVNGDPLGQSLGLYKPTGLYYCGGVKSLSFVSPTANAIVQAAFLLKPSPNQGT